MANARLLRLAQRIAAKTEDEELSWEETTDDNVYTVSFPRYSIAIARSPETIEKYEYFSLRVFNEKGQLIDQMIDREASTENIDLGKLFNEARRNAMGADKALDELLLELETHPKRKS
jgi:hypothetical protein